MQRLSLWPVVLGLALAMIVVALVKPVEHSLGYASVALVVIGLIGWVMEAREVAGPPPAVEPEHEEEEPAPGPSYWPLIVAAGIVGIAGGLVYEWEYGALIIALPLAVGAAAAWGEVVRREIAPSPGQEEAPPVAPPVVVGGRVLMPVAPNVLAAQAAGGAAIALERVGPRPISRRNLLRATFWVGLGAGLLAAVASIIDFMYPRGIVGFGGVINAGSVDRYPPGTKTQVPAGRFWLVHLTAEQGGPGILALWWKCPHLGCTVPWRPTFTFTDPGTGEAKQGWFRCPCHGSTYNDAGVRVFGPAPRSMDHMEVTIENGQISVNTGKITKGTPDNAQFAVKV
ncbi:MAG TPA: Rieske 2Fe-2S domain-containing protein [Dehalococcoidia bacterium]|nr:Rieske 2Fe-2S domain-containing protein [Dehalococcoidia bacterium]